MSPKRRPPTVGAGRAVVPRATGSSSNAAAMVHQSSQRVTAAVVLTFILLCTAISLYDLMLLLKLLGR